MIVNYPTGLFKTVLPSGPSDAGNVTWTCSSTKPPRSNLFFLQITPGAIRRRPSIPGDLARRSSRAQLVYTVAGSGATTPAAGTKQYESGQVLEFVSGPDLELLPQQVGPSTVIRHDTNLLDLGSLGMDPQEVRDIEQKSVMAMEELIKDLNGYRSQRADLEVQISGNQRSINEANKALAALDAVITVLDDDAARLARDRLAARLQALEDERSGLIRVANTLALQTDAAQDELLRVSQLVR